MSAMAKAGIVGTDRELRRHEEAMIRSLVAVLASIWRTLMLPAPIEKERCLGCHTWVAAWRPCPVCWNERTAAGKRPGARYLRDWSM